MTTTTTTTATIASKNLGIVSNCTLVGARFINVYSDYYCAVNKGHKTQSEAVSLCSSLNARLPLPKNDAEMSAFFKFSPKPSWIGIRDEARGQNFKIFLIKSKF